MIGDILLITENHRKAAREIITKLGKEKSLNKYIIAISGESGSGKSELSHMVAKYLKKDNIYTKILHSDDFYKIKPIKRSEWRKNHGLESIGINEIDWDKIHLVIQSFKKSEKCSMPSIDLLTDQVDTLTTDFNDIKVLIVEGLYSLNIEANLKVFIELTYLETKLSQKIRGKEELDEERLKILEREHREIQSLKSRADLYVTKDFSIINT
ncbi:MAG: Uridine kinase [Candidatus Heimdallarchaeota archaeon LC_3]|nr:MAG: Uridine kinase [Candidatus Heimdallarchaeota archaeon LC_3]